jgi:hypothetical protein
MYEDQSTNALTEISLALAMGIFALLILALISMGPSQHSAQQQGDQIHMTTLEILPSSDSTSRASDTIINSDLFVVDIAGKLRDRYLNEVSAGQIQKAKRIVVGIDPSMSAIDASKIRSDIDHPNVILTPLNRKWLESLKDAEGT